MVTNCYSHLAFTISRIQLHRPIYALADPLTKNIPITDILIYPGTKNATIAHHIAKQQSLILNHVIPNTIFILSFNIIMSCTDPTFLF